MATKAGTLPPPAKEAEKIDKVEKFDQHERETTFDIFRRWGYLQASLDPLGQYLPPEPFPTPAPEGEIAAEARGYYCGTIAAEFMHIANVEQRQWLQAQIEQTPPAPGKFQDQALILTQLIRADIFEQVIQSRYLGTKRFSLEGITALIPFLDRVLAVSAEIGVTKAMIAMSHRGRLNVMTNTIGRSPSEIFTKFEDVDPRSVMGGGDVKYHVGATGEYRSPNGEVIALHLASNPSHLEAIDPVVLGRTRAKQERIGKGGKDEVLPVIIHGDAAFAGQGIVAETLNMATLHGFNVGGTIHVIVNNLLGFTALPEESNSSRFSSDIAKRLPIPIFHVNAEDPDAVVRIAAIAAEYRHRFHSDIVIDLIGYRKHGHSEVGDPTVTQPRRYAIIKDRPALYQLYAKRIGVDPAAEVQQFQQALFDDQKAATKAEQRRRLGQLACDAHHRACRRRYVLPHRLPHPPQGQKALRAKAGDGSRNSPFRLRNGRARSLRIAARTGNPSPPHRIGLAARNLQPKTRRNGRYRDRSPLHPASSSQRKAGKIRGLQLTPLRGRGARLRIRLLTGLSRGARPLGGAVRRLRKRRADHHGPVHRGKRSQVGPALGPRHAPSARLRRPRPGALQRAHRALPAACRKRQHSDMSAFKRRAVLPPPAPSGDASLAQAARCLHAEEHVAPPRRLLHARRLRSAQIPECSARQRRKESSSPPGLQRKDRPQSPRRAREAQRHGRRHHLPRADVPLARGRVASRSRPASRR